MKEETRVSYEAGEGASSKRRIFPALKYEKRKAVFVVEGQRSRDAVLQSREVVGPVSMSVTSRNRSGSSAPAGDRTPVSSAMRPAWERM